MKPNVWHEEVVASRKSVAQRYEEAGEKLLSLVNKASAAELLDAVYDLNAAYARINELELFLGHFVRVSSRELSITRSDLFQEADKVLGNTSQRDLPNDFNKEPCRAC